MFDMDGDALDGLDMAQLEALSAQLRGERGPRVTQAGVSRNKLRQGRKKGIRHGFGVEEVGSINETVDVVISLPLYMVVGMESLGSGLSYREAVRDYLRSRGLSEWAESRFVTSSRGDQMRARDRFTRKFG
jgi:hypothetical protein